MKTIATIWEVWTYDVWGNAEDGWEVNDCSCIDRHCELELLVETYNYGTPRAFDGASPTDEDIKDVLGIRADVAIETDGDDLAIYVTAADDGYPLGELHCISHKSLSPIEAQ